jgi:hypothetical protein
VERGLGVQGPDRNSLPGQKRAGGAPMGCGFHECPPRGRVKWGEKGITPQIVVLTLTLTGGGEGEGGSPIDNVPPPSQRLGGAATPGVLPRGPSIGTAGGASSSALVGPAVDPWEPYPRRGGLGVNARAQGSGPRAGDGSNGGCPVPRGSPAPPERRGPKVNGGPPPRSPRWKTPGGGARGPSAERQPSWGSTADAKPKSPFQTQKTNAPSGVQGRERATEGGRPLDPPQQRETTKTNSTDGGKKTVPVGEPWSPGATDGMATGPETPKGEKNRLQPVFYACG